MIRNEVTVAEAIELLNEALAADRAGVSALVNERVICNAALSEHPTIQVGQMEGNITNGEPAIAYKVGLLGILNGLFGTDETGYGPISAIVDDGLVRSFERT